MGGYPQKAWAAGRCDLEELPVCGCSSRLSVLAEQCPGSSSCGQNSGMILWATGCCVLPLTWKPCTERDYMQCSNDTS